MRQKTVHAELFIFDSKQWTWLKTREGPKERGAGGQGSGVFAADQIERLLEAQGVEAAVRVLGPQLLGELGELGHDGHLPPEAVDLGPLPLLAHDLPHLQLVGVGGHVLVVGRPVVVGVRCNCKRKGLGFQWGQVIHFVNNKVQAKSKR